MASPIKPNMLIKVTQLFNDKKWPLDNGTLQNLSLFQKYCERLKLFDINQQELIINLTKNFIIINLNKYLEQFYDLFICLGDSLIYSNRKIFVYPLVDPYVKFNKNQIKIPQNKTKSANFLHYMLESADYTWLSKNIIPSNSIEKLKREFNNNDSLLILIDDFIGSGNTAIDVCKIYLAEKFNDENINHENIRIVSIAAQKAGIENIKKTVGIDAITNLVLLKGISDFYKDQELTYYKTAMEQIERKLKIDEKYNFGYEKSEALITFLNKTPNNTFPVYWHETKNHVAPFPRYKKYLMNGN